MSEGLVGWLHLITPCHINLLTHLILYELDALSYH